MHLGFCEFPRTNFGNLRCNLHWCYTFLLRLNCTALSQSESSNFFLYIIKPEKNNKFRLVRDTTGKKTEVYLSCRPVLLHLTDPES